MKSLIKAVAVAAAIVAPIASFAQSSQPVTRAQVRADLDVVVKAGYNPRDWMHYPDNIQAAEARVAAQSGTSGYGVNGAGASQSGQRADDAVNSH
ncbi:MAG TPA: DUF4148 domain-containing protein [Trinickia sp.]|jgi:opacity protein-like surface antigen|nr:DUF4148 domain-containing protein [Trinickia sp.]